MKVKDRLYRLRAIQAGGTVGIIAGIVLVIVGAANELPGLIVPGILLAMVSIVMRIYQAVVLWWHGGAEAWLQQEKNELYRGDSE